MLLYKKMPCTRHTVYKLNLGYFSQNKCDLFTGEICILDENKCKSQTQYLYHDLCLSRHLGAAVVTQFDLTAMKWKPQTLKKTQRPNAADVVVTTVGAAESAKGCCRSGLHFCTLHQAPLYPLKVESQKIQKDRQISPHLLMPRDLISAQNHPYHHLTFAQSPLVHLSCICPKENVQRMLPG